MSKPVWVHSHIGNADETASRTMRGFAGDNLLSKGDFVIRVQIEVQNFLPHRRDKYEVALLAQVFLRDLELDGFVGFFESTEQRGDGFAHLKIDRPMLDLNDDVVFELSVKWMEIIVGCLCAISLQVAPIQVMVVDKCAIEDDPMMRLESSRNDIRSIGWSPSVGCGSE